LRLPRRRAQGCGGEPSASARLDSTARDALCLHEAGMIKSSPDKIIADGADWRLLREVKKELG
jgi:hypothetical protein